MLANFYKLLQAISTIYFSCIILQRTVDVFFFNGRQDMEYKAMRTSCLNKLRVTIKQQLTGHSLSFTKLPAPSLP